MVQPLRAKLLELEDIPHQGDVCDWLDAGHTAAELQVLIDAAPDLDEIEQAKREHKRRLARERQRRHRGRLRVAAIMSRADCHAVKGRMSLSLRFRSLLIPTTLVLSRA